MNTQNPMVSPYPSQKKKCYFMGTAHFWTLPNISNIIFLVYSHYIYFHYIKNKSPWSGLYMIIYSKLCIYIIWSKYGYILLYIDRHSYIIIWPMLVLCGYYMRSQIIPVHLRLMPPLLWHTLQQRRHACLVSFVVGQLPPRRFMGRPWPLDCSDQP